MMISADRTAASRGHASVNFVFRSSDSLSRRAAAPHPSPFGSKE